MTRGLLVLLAIAGVLVPMAQAAAINVAFNKPAEANNVYPPLIPGNAVDGNWESAWAAALPGTPTLPMWLTVDLEGVYSIDSIVLVGPHGNVPGNTHVYNLYSTLDGFTWELITSGTLTDTFDYVHTVDTDGDAMRGIKYEVVGGTHWAGLYELEAYGSDVPEPSSLLLVAGALGLAALRLRRGIRA